MKKKNVPWITIKTKIQWSASSVLLSYMSKSDTISARSSLWRGEPCSAKNNQLCDKINSNRRHVPVSTWVVLPTNNRYNWPTGERANKPPHCLTTKKAGNLSVMNQAGCWWTWHCPQCVVFSVTQSNNFQLRHLKEGLNHLPMSQSVSAIPLHNGTLLLHSQSCTVLLFKCMGFQIKQCLLHLELFHLSKRSLCHYGKWLNLNIVNHFSLWITVLSAEK